MKFMKNFMPLVVGNSLNMIHFTVGLLHKNEVQILFFFCFIKMITLNIILIVPNMLTNF